MNRCRHMTLAHQGNCQIDYCEDCQVMHLHIDALTLKLQRESLAALGNLIVDALQKLQCFENDADSMLRHFMRPGRPPH